MPGLDLLGNVPVAYQPRDTAGSSLRLSDLSQLTVGLDRRGGSLEHPEAAHRESVTTRRTPGLLDLVQPVVSKAVVDLTMDTDGLLRLDVDGQRLVAVREALVGYLAARPAIPAAMTCVDHEEP